MMGRVYHSEETKRRVGELYGQGLTTVEVGEQLGLTENQVNGIVHRLGIHRRIKQPSPTPPEAQPYDRFPDWQVPEGVDWREWFASWDRILELHKRADPYQESLVIDYADSSVPIAMVSASDLHLGGGFTDHPAILETIAFILKTPNMYLGLAGDTIEGFIPGVKPAETVEQQIAPVKAQLKALESLVDELTEKGKLWYMSWGDHDAKWFEQTVGVNVVKLLVDRKVPYFVGRGTIKLKVGEQEYWLLVNHSERFHSQYHATHPQRRAMDTYFPLADVVIAGHRHKPAFHWEHFYPELDRLGVGFGETTLVANGTFKTGPDPYSIRGWSRGVMGVPTLVFSGDRHDVDVFKDPVKAAHHLSWPLGTQSQENES